MVPVTFLNVLNIMVTFFADGDVGYDMVTWPTVTSVTSVTTVVQQNRAGTVGSASNVGPVLYSDPTGQVSQRSCALRGLPRDSSHPVALPLNVDPAQLDDEIGLARTEASASPAGVEVEVGSGQGYSQ